MIRGLEAVMIGSGDAKALADFYVDKVGLKIKEEYEGDEGAYVLEMEVGEGSGFYINNHSKVKGKSTNPERILLNFEVDDIEKEFPKLKDAGVKVIEPIYHNEGYGLIATLEDLDGNYFQLVQVRPTPE